MPGTVSDSSTLIHLAAIGRLELLKEMHGTITVPQAVWREVVEQGAGRPGAAEVQDACAQGWMQVATPADSDLVRILQRDLHPGEAEAIALARECDADAVFLDESDARRAADSLGLEKTGIVGLLVRARLDGRVTSLREELDRLRDEGGFRLGDRVYREALDLVGESPDSPNETG